MIIGVPKEIKDYEYRVSLTPDGARVLLQAGHRVVVEPSAGQGSGFSDDAYRQAGVQVAGSKAEVFQQADLIVKVKEPQLSECVLFRPGQVLFTYLHLASLPDLTKALVAADITAIAYETVEARDHSLPMLRPMSEIAGRLAVQIGAHYLGTVQGGRGLLLAGVPGVPPAHVVVLGAGVVGTSAVRIAVGMGARVTVINLDLDRLRFLDDLYGGRIATCAATESAIERAVVDADLVIGAVLVPGARAPKVVSRALVKKMKPGSVIVDVAVDQGGCCETTRPTTHSDPVYVVDGVLHYCVTNMPGIVPHTSTLALTNTTLPYIVRLASEGVEKAIRSDPGLAKGVNVMNGRITCQGVADAYGLRFTPVM
ncbi:MAG: alanine dehydrogenase [Nitrospira sp.]|jgi:alanine dehydrogenase|uniref:alanine dehydrogenase n=1 Tax=Nitrospira sp. ND1 TaxID=1658518 RepID=UPI0009B98CBC|nr:alanine dehydrogenase [Nitrospira sp. ND1]MBK7419438.1 alanine dehydrogenase [Nitrospira sp.]OYT21844.1 MAG: alanine dehydrogenase [Nitrospira sp. UW-LDO-02]MBK8378675.1 alanine dehydrogenase [Nitrospira sp.]MBK9996828.1 alanine dehydrogenase [Nitrospira sp.]MBP6198509.1 alanine dehydrogenase [Nitrospira sp.]